jgi:hypothetical protein
LFAGSDGSSDFGFVKESYLADILDLRYVGQRAFPESISDIYSRFAEHVKLAALIPFNNVSLTGNQCGVNLKPQLA